VLNVSSLTDQVDVRQSQFSAVGDSIVCCSRCSIVEQSVPCMHCCMRHVTGPSRTQTFLFKQSLSLYFVLFFLCGPCSF